MIYWRFKEEPKGGIYDWLLENKHDILAGIAEYEGTPVTESSEFYQYKYVVSFGFVTLIDTTQHYLPTAKNGYLRTTPWKYSFITLLLGWWCFPWGPIFTIHALMFNFGRARKRTAASLLQLVEWGWDAPHDASVDAHKKKILELTSPAAEKIRALMVNGGFDEELGVRITPVERGGPEVEITFDYPISDGSDWIDESDGLVLLIDKKHELQLLGHRLDYEDGRFLLRH